MASYRVLLRCVVDCETELGTGDSLSAFGHAWRVDEVIPEPDGEAILVCTLATGEPVSADA